MGPLPEWDDREGIAIAFLKSRDFGVRVDGGSIRLCVAIDVPEREVANEVVFASEESADHLILFGSTSAPTSLNNLVLVIFVRMVNTVPAADTGPRRVVTLVVFTFDALKSPAVVADFLETVGSSAMECVSTSSNSPGRESATVM